MEDDKCPFSVPTQQQKGSELSTAMATSWVVQKFGGTSLGKMPSEIVDIIKSSLTHQRIAVVCSARSSHTKNEGTTTRLLRAANLAKNHHHFGSTNEIDEIVDSIKDDHIQAARSSFQSPGKYEEIVAMECRVLLNTLKSMQQFTEINLTAENEVISTGEKLASQYLSALLEEQGIPTCYIDLSDVVDRYSITTEVVESNLYKALTDAFRQDVSTAGSKVPILTGYFGNLDSGLLRTVGRGYSDLAAALVAIGIPASELQIWKEVDGIFTADPRKVSTARLLPTVSPGEAAELTYFGSEVIHPHTMDQVIRAKIPIRIKNVRNPTGNGTVIVPDSPTDGITPAPEKSGLLISRGPSSMDLQNLEVPKSPTAITVKRSVLVLNLSSNKTTRAHGFLSRIFQVLDTHHLSVDLIASSEIHVSLALHCEPQLHTSITYGPSETSKDTSTIVANESLQRACSDLEHLGSVNLATDMAIISLVGRNLKHMIGISGKFFRVLGKEGVNIEMISQGATFASSLALPFIVSFLFIGFLGPRVRQIADDQNFNLGASEINISCVVRESDADRALGVVHTNLFTFPE
ncbi:uncharacterized protein KY384_003048 [Bacidia gigantensis]|uniref:uncharacterized protein n=1 Tax=Bacidia gigantensis TaxID=2732470 RepID=UPI001D04D946|nr:uncharacterized protein KY384_003048 [Bacidia gigantensis]KAG8531419.1 hypothetical protein KY384_003048 [Bacidia gigantensis]